LTNSNKINENEIVFDKDIGIFLQLKNKMIEIYGEFYFKYHSDNENDERKYIPVKNSIARTFLISLYNQFVKTNECEPIENIPKKNKEYYWELSKKISSVKEVMINCSKSMYCLDLITNNFKPCQENLTKEETVL
jgi:hypothetical protein